MLNWAYSTFASDELTSWDRHVAGAKAAQDQIQRQKNRRCPSCERLNSVARFLETQELQYLGLVARTMGEARGQSNACL